MKKKIFFLFTLVSLMGTKVWALDQKDGVYQIGTSAELAEFATLVNEGNTGINAVLTSDIDFSANSEMIGVRDANPFRGTFDGNGHTITLGYNTTTPYTGLFCFIDGATVKNLTLDGSVESNQVHLGPVAGRTTGDCTLENVLSAVSVVSTIYGATGDSGLVGLIWSGSITFNNCGFIGSIYGVNGNQYGGFAGWSMSGIPVIINNSIVTASFHGGTGGSRTFVTGEGAVRVNNCYYLNAIGAEQGTQMSAEQFASGEVCYLLNGDQSVLSWYQTLGEDATPVTDATHSVVYATALRCDGKPLEGCEFSNDATSVNIPSHDYEGYTCTLCGSVNPDYCAKEDGFYLIGNADQLVWFALMVNTGNTTVNAKLTADIDFSANSEMIGTGNGLNAAINPFRGIFDGNGHTITLGYNTTEMFTGLFHYMDGASVRNLTLAGNVESNQVHLGPVVGHATGDCTFDKVLSAVNVTSTIYGATGDSGFVGIIVSGSATFNNCGLVGSINGANGVQYGGFAGWSMSGIPVTFNNCMVAASFNGGTGNSRTFATGEGAIGVNNCYYLNAIGAEQGTKMSAEQFASGEVCYLLNGAQSVLSWYQNLGEDATPVLDATHSVVYATSLRCDGQPLEGCEYTNDKAKAATIPDHEYENGVCIVCGQEQKGFMEPDEDGFYNIENAEQLAWFALFVNSGNTTVNAKLTEDIDFSSNTEMIGTGNGVNLPVNPFQGIFDGDFHTITLGYNTNLPFTALFQFIDGATIKNLYLDGYSMSNQVHLASVAGHATGNNLFQNVISAVNVMSDMDAASGAGGLVGLIYSGTSTFENCSFVGSLTGEYTFQLGGFVGWVFTKSMAVLNNCFITASFNGGTGNSRTFVAGNGINGNAEINNCYYFNPIGVAEGTQMSEEQFKNGTVCYYLNHRGMENPTWFQDLEDDPYPVTEPSHGIVFPLGDNEYFTVKDESTLSQWLYLFIDNETEYIANVVASVDSKDKYGEAVNTFGNAEIDMESIISAYKVLQAEKIEFAENVEAYAAYMTLAQEIRDYMANNTVSGTYAERLDAYLNGDAEPGEEFPNGGYEYIIDNAELSTDDIIAEREFLNAMYSDMLTHDFQKDTDITQLLTNADFHSGNNGWNGKDATGYYTEIPLVECFNNTCNLYQTLTELKDGVYELDMNAFFRPAGRNDSRFYTTSLYVNDLMVPVMSVEEDPLPQEEDINLDDYDSFGEDGLIPVNVNGAAAAFNKGFYQNRILVNVTDGTLTVGLRADGTGMPNDWTVFNNVKLYYRGGIEVSDDALDAVLSGMVNRAISLLEAKVDLGEYNIYPNFYTGIKNELQTAIESASGSNSTESKYALVQTFSNLFREAQDCQRAYVDLMNRIETISSVATDANARGIISTEDLDEMLDACDIAIAACDEGALTSEEAKNWNLDIYTGEKDGEWYLIDNANELAMFALIVNAGQTNICGKLTADIDFSANTEMIGTGNGLNAAINPYRGVFNGNGHTITLGYNTTEPFTGLFHYLDGATVMNLTLDGSVESNQVHLGPVVGHATGDCTFDKVLSAVNVTSTIYGATGDSGLVGIIVSGSATFNNCGFVGSINGEVGVQYGGFAGWSMPGIPVTFNNCMVAASFNGGAGNSRTFATGDGAIIVNNCYYLNAIGAEQGTQKSAEQFANGEVCYLLNGDQSIISWYQTLGEDAYPVLDESHQIVIFEDDKYANPDGITEVSADNRRQTLDVYDLSGRKVNPNPQLPKGIYIINGKKIMAN